MCEEGQSELSNKNVYNFMKIFDFFYCIDLSWKHRGIDCSKYISLMVKCLFPGEKQSLVLMFNNFVFD